MRVKWALLCAQVEINPEGTYNLGGVTEQLISAIIPSTIGRFAVVLGATVLTPGRFHLWTVWRLAKTNEIVFHSDPNENPIAIEAAGVPSNSIIPILHHDVTLPEFGQYLLEVMKNDQMIYIRTLELGAGPTLETHSLRP